jgi:histidyl-tRNA synthetase
MKLNTQPYKGARDFYPEDKRLQNYMFETMRRVVGKYGYEEYDAPILEPLDIYRAKTGEEIVNEQLYSFTDRGDREIALRPEMTPTVSRMVAARRQELAYPLRWFSIPNLWRYERPQKGRLREHWQLNVDIFGEEGIEAEHEMILIADYIMRQFGAKSSMYEIRLNSRKLVDFTLNDYLGLDTTQSGKLIKLIDKKHKMEQAKFTEAISDVFSDSQREAGLPEKLLTILECKDVASLPDEVKNHGSIDGLVKLKNLLAKSKIKNAVFDMSLMRGFDYYTDIVFEVFDTDPDNNRSMFGGGRYDGLVGLFGVDPLPTVGFGMGDVTLANFLKSHHLVPKLPSEINAIAILIGNVYEASLPVLSAIRAEGISVSVDASDKKLDKKLKSADKQDIPHVIFIGENELAEGKYPLKNLNTGEESKHSIESIISELKQSRN